MTTRADIDQSSATMAVHRSEQFLQSLRDRLDEYMNEKGHRSTEQRRQIVDALFAAPSHVTIDGLWELVRGKHSNIGYATVYRTLKLLAECGVVEEYQFGDGFTRYELAEEDGHHDHMICQQCGKIEEFEEPLIEELQRRIAEKYGFTLTTHKHELYGTCSQCRQKGPAS